MARRTKRSARLVAGLVLAMLTFAAHGLPQGVTQGPTVEGVTEYTLEDGLRVLLFPDATQPKTTVNITYLVGSRQENYGETGMAHLLEHLMFKGTPTRGNLMTEMGKRGMSFNGTTSFDRTNYFETFPVSAESLDWALAMEADRMVNSYIAKKDLDSEMTVVRNEMEKGENSPHRILTERMLAAAFEWHNYGKETIGARSDVENVNIERLQAFYRTYYQPDNAVLIIAGAFDSDQALALVVKYFGPIPRPARTLPPVYTVEPVQDGERQVILRRVGNTQLAGALYHTVPEASPEYVALDALTEIMTIAPSGRLYKALVETKLASAVYGENYGLRDPGMVFFFAQVPDQDPLQKARDAMLSVLEGLKAQPITEAEVDRVRAKALKEIDQTMNDPQKLGRALSESSASGDWRLFFVERDRWRKVSAADVERVAESYLKPSNRTLGEYVPDAKPDRAPAPPTVDVAALVKDYKGDPAVAAGETFDPTPANLDARAQRFTLPNGMKVVLLPKKTRGETVQFLLQLHIGDEKAVFGKDAEGSLAAGMLLRGTARHSRQEIEDTLDRLRARLSINGGATSATAHGETVRAQLADTLRLLSEVLREPSFPAAEFDQLKRERLAAIEERRTDPGDVAERTLDRYDNPYPAGDVRYTPTVDEEVKQIEAVRLDAAKGFHAHFVGGAHAELALVGDFDSETTRPLVAELFGSWQSRAPFTRVPDPLVAKRPKEIQVQTPDKANAVLAGELALPLNDMSADYAAFQVANYILGGSTSSRLWNRIRQQEGISYSVYTYFQPNSFEENTPLVLDAIFAPENMQRLRTALKEELTRAVRDGFTAAEVTDAKNALLQRRTLARTQDPRLADDLARQAYLGRTFGYAAGIDAAIASSTTDQVNAALRKYVQPERFVSVFAGDFAKLKSK